MMPTSAQIIAFIPDIILIVISGLACLYCYLLSRRLRKLNNLETGLGASIITLTRAIEETYKAAQDAQTSTAEAVKTLRDLLERSDNLTPKADTIVKDMERAFERARDKQDQLEYAIDVSLSRAVDKAETTATGLLQIVSEIHEKDASISLSQPAYIDSETHTVEQRKAS